MVPNLNIGLSNVVGLAKKNPITSLQLIFIIKHLGFNFERSFY